MSDIIKFPTKTVRDNVLIEKSIKDILSKTPADEETIQELTNRALKLFNKYQCEFSPSFKLPLPSSLSDDEKKEIIKSIEHGIINFERALHDHMNEILLERIQTEIKLYFFENPI